MAICRARAAHPTRAASYRGTGPEVPAPRATAVAGRECLAAQAERVWAPLETTDAPLFVYVPAGQLARAQDFARAAGIGSVRFRTWRRQPGSVLVEEF